MKKTYILIFAVLTVATAWAQPSIFPSQHFENGHLFPQHYLPKSGIEAGALATRMNQRNATDPTVKQRLDSLIIERWDTLNSVWNTSRKELYTYDKYGNTTGIFYYSFRKQDDQYVWIPQAKSDDYIYDEKLNLVGYSEFRWVSQDSIWVKEGKYELTYTTDGILDVIIYYTWNDEMSDWTPYNSIHYFYQENDDLIIMGYYWSSDENSWLKSAKNEFIFEWNDNANISVIKSHRWDEDLKDWRYLEKGEYVYDPDSEQTTYTVYLGYGELDEWATWAKYEYFHNTAYVLQDLILPISYFPNRLQFRYLIEEAFSYLYLGDGLKLRASNTLYYSEQEIETIPQVTFLKNQESLNPVIHIFPNPTADLIRFISDKTLHNAEFKLIDLQGKTVLSEPLAPNKNIPVQHLSPGLYVYEINYDDRLQKGKIRIE